MNESFHVRVTVKTDDEKIRSYIKNDVCYRDRDEAIEVGKKAFEDTPEVIMVEVFQSGVAKPVAFFQ